MKPQHYIIRILTITLFISLMTGFVILKSGCSKQLSYNHYLNQTAELLAEQDIQSEFDKYREEGKLDTIRLDTTDDFLVVKELIPGSKSPYLAIKPDDIFKFIPADSLPDKFVPINYIIVYFREYEIWRRAQMVRDGKPLPDDKKRKKKKEDNKASSNDMMNSSKSMNGPIFKIEEDTSNKTNN